MKSLRSHEPRPEFKADLERVVRMELARNPVLRNRFHWRGFRAASAIVIALISGFGAGLLPAQVQDSRARQGLLEAEEAARDLARERLELARANAARAQLAYNAGLTPQEPLLSALSAVQRLESDLARIALNIEEVRQASRAPRDDISAPRVAGRDFVTERLSLEIAAANEALTIVEERLEALETRHRLGIVALTEVLPARTEEVRAKSKLETLLGRRDLRARYVSGQVSPEDATRELTRLELMQEIGVVEQLIVAAESRLERLEALRRVGRVDEVGLARGQLEVSELVAQLRDMQRNLEMIDGR